MSVLVTGGSGFLGRHVVAEFRRAGATVAAPSHDEYPLTQERSVGKLLADTRPETVVHLAGRVGGIQANRLRPAEFFYDNLIMGAMLMEQARCWGVKKFVCVGTVCSYPKHTPVPFREDDLWSGYPEETNAPYGIAKRALLMQALSYRRQYGFNAIYLIPTNLYGPWDNFDPETGHVVPGLIRKMAAAAGQPWVECWGTGRATRDFLYVEDAAEAIVTAAYSYNDAGPLNLGSGTETPIRRLAEVVAVAVGYRGEIRWNAEYPDGQPRRCLNSDRAEERIGFRPKTGLEEGIKKTVEWYRTHVEPTGDDHNLAV